MTTAYALLLHLCGLSHQEAADLHRVRLDTVRSWASGRRTVAAGAVAELRALAAGIDRAAAEALALFAEQRARAGDAKSVDVVELGLFVCREFELNALGAYDAPCIPRNS